MVKLLFTDTNPNGLHLQFRCYAPIKILMVHITTAKYMLIKSGQYFDVSHGYEYYFDVNETHNMLNWVNEEGYTRAAVRCEAYSVDDYHGAWFGGYWYPDI